MTNSVESLDTVGREKLSKRFLQFCAANGKAPEDYGLDKSFCQALRSRPWYIGAARQKRLYAIMEEKPPKPKHGYAGPTQNDVRRCRGCVHWDETSDCCSFILDTGHPRGCKGGVECKMYKEGVRENVYRAAQLRAILEAMP